MTADEILRLQGAIKDNQGGILEPGKMLIFIAGQKPILGNQVLYFMDKTMQKRSLIPPPTIG